MKKKNMLFLLLIAFIQCMGCKINNEDWENKYSEIIKNADIRNELIGEADCYSFYDFQGDGIPELLLAKQSEDGEDIFSRIIVLQYNGKNVEIVYDIECRMINVYCINSKDLLLWYPNSMGNPIEQIKILDGKVETVMRIWAEDEYIMNRYENENIITQEFITEEYGDCFSIVADECEEIKFANIN